MTKLNLSRRDFLSYSAAIPLLLSGVNVSAAEPTQKIHSARGRIRINGKLATSGEPLRSGDVVSTDADSEAKFLLNGEAYKLGANSQLEIQHNDGAKGTLRLVTGSLLAVFQPTNKTLVTPGATIGIRGTGVYLEVSAAETYFCTCFGHTEMLPKGHSQSQHTKATHHQGCTISHERTAKVGEADMRGHTDADVRDLAALIQLPLSAEFQ